MKLATTGFGEDRIGGRIRRARKSAGLSQADLAAHVDVSQPTVANWELGAHDPRRGVLEKVAEALGVSAHWLSYGEGMDPDDGGLGAADYFRTPIAHVPVIAWSDVSALAHDPAFDPVAAASRFIPWASTRRRLFALAVEDPAMDREFPTGSLVIIDCAERAAFDGGIFLFRLGGRWLLRRWRDAPARIEPCSNEPQHDPVFLTEAAAITGRAVASLRTY